MNRKFRNTLLFCLLGVSVLSHAGDLVKVPANSDWVVDEAGLLTGSEKEQISASLRQFQAEMGAQIELLTVPELGGEPVESFSLRVVDAWKPGLKKQDNGILLLVSQKEHKVRIEVGQGLEGQLPDITAGRIITNVIVPRFKQQDYSGGIIAGLSAIAHGMGGELKNAPAYQTSRRGRSSGSSGGLFFILIILFIVMSRFGNQRNGGFGSFLTGMLLGEVLGSGGRGGGGFGGDGGGFGGGGGGGFSGGGASGDW